MSLWRQITHGLHALTNRAAADQDVADEVQDYLERTTAVYQARGLTTDAAQRAARLELGGVSNVHEAVRSYGWENLVETLLADLRFAVRRLRAEPAFTAVTVLTLALGIGGTTAIFSAVNPILFQALPYPDPGRVVMIRELGGDGSRIDGTFGMYRGLIERDSQDQEGEIGNHSFAAIAVVRSWQPTMTSAGQPERFEGQRVSAGFFKVLGISPVLGRAFLVTDDRLNGPNVVVISDVLWRRRFNRDPAIVGRTITLNDNPWLVIGVMPPSFENVLGPSAELWAPLQYDMSQGRAWGHHLTTIGRLRPEVSLADASRELNLAGHAVVTEQHPQTYGVQFGLDAVSLQGEITRGVRPALLVILGAMTLVLVIVCVNVANLLLARGARRRGEFALRAALGAGQQRLVRQLLTEGLLLAALGGVAGITVAVLGVRALIALSPPGLQRLGAIGVDPSVFAFGLGVTALIGLALSLAPALQAARTDPNEGLVHGSPRTAGGTHRARTVLVVSEVALALALLVSSGLLLRSLKRLFAVEVGFDPAHLLTMQVQTSGHRFEADSTTYRFFERALESVREVPGVTAAALTSQLPLSGDLDVYGVHFDPMPLADPGEVRGTFRYAVSPGYIETMGIPLRRGRLLDDRDAAGAPLVALISESMAKRRLPGLDPIGQRLKIGDGVLYTIVGVVGDVKQMSLALSESDAVYITPSQWHFADNAMSLVVRTRGDPASLVSSVRQAVWSVDKDQPIVRVATMPDLLAASAAQRRFALILFEGFALAALVLAAAGIYGVLAGSVAERTREIGLRAALGASRGNILSLVVGQGMKLTAVGAAIGLTGAAVASQVMTAMLFGISNLDPLTYLGALVVLAGVSVIACSVPAWRAVQVDPAGALRAS